MGEVKETPMPNRTSSDAVGTRLDQLAWKPIHTWITMALGIGWLLDAFEVNVVGNVLGVLRDEGFAQAAVVGAFEAGEAGVRLA